MCQNISASAVCLKSRGNCNLMYSGYNLRRSGHSRKPTCRPLKLYLPIIGPVSFYISAQESFCLLAIQESADALLPGVPVRWAEDYS